MLDLCNKTPWTVALLPVLGKWAEETLVVVIKATFAVLNGVARPADAQLPIALADQHYGEPEKTSVRVESDLCPPKSGTDVVLVSQALCARPLRRTSVLINAGKLHKEVAVIGDRAWYKSAIRWKATEPEPFERMPLVYERAYGGFDSPRLDAQRQGDPRNPVGTGFFAADRGPVEGQRLPNLEDPDFPIQSPGDRPAPAGFGVISRGWEPRNLLAGTFDTRWREERCPLLPLDFDDAYFNGASPGLISRPHLRGGEPFEVLNVAPKGRWVFTLPSVSLRVTASIQGECVEAPCVLDTVLLEPEKDRVALTLKAAVPCSRKFLSVERVILASL